MSRYLWSIAFCLLACNTIDTASVPIQVQGAHTSGDLVDLSVPITATKYVSLHADRALRGNNSCTQVLRLNLVQKKDYQDTIIELKNRAVLMGGNSVSLLGWRESGSKTVLLSNIYMCRDKIYHLHPHPQSY